MKLNRILGNLAIAGLALGAFAISRRRKTAAHERDSQEDLLDNALEETFPASDPISP